VTFTVAAVPTASSLTPGQGPVTGGTTVTIIGTGFVPGQTTVTIGGITIPASQVTVSSDGTSLTFVTPPHALGKVDVTVGTPGGTSGPLPFTYVPAAPVITSPTDGSTTDATPLIEGTGTPGDTVTVRDGDGSGICTAVVDSTGHWHCTPTAPFDGGAQAITATQTSPDGQTSAQSAAVHFTVNALASTGVDVWRELMTALAVLLLGINLMVYARRRTREV